MSHCPWRRRGGLTVSIPVVHLRSTSDCGVLKCYVDEGSLSDVNENREVVFAETVREDLAEVKLTALTSSFSDAINRRKYRSRTPDPVAIVNDLADIQFESMKNITEKFDIDRNTTLVPQINIFERSIGSKSCG
ncbi:hypothetical protein FGB62_309g03 [Gracilaria domingensis]|nr:hypothetical protein FGB62_309g03 [Gracilaria domingensis]